jgi:hypothetical protein
MMWKANVPFWPELDKVQSVLQKGIECSNQNRCHFEAHKEHLHQIAKSTVLLILESYKCVDHTICQRTEIFFG